MTSESLFDTSRERALERIAKAKERGWPLREDGDRVQAFVCGAWRYIGQGPWMREVPRG